MGSGELMSKNRNCNIFWKNNSVISIGKLGMWKCSKTKLRKPVPVAAHHVTIHNKPIHNILSTAPQLSISQKVLETLPEDGNVMPKHVGATINN
jgi:hypothetical protein